MRIAVTSRSFSKHPILRHELEARYPDVLFNDAGLSLRGRSLAEFLGNRDAAIVALEPIDDSLLNELPQLRVISKYGVGLDNIDQQSLSRRGIRLGWTGGVNRRSVAELVISASISLLRHVPRASQSLRDGNFKQTMGRQLSSQTVGILGCGHVGKELARLLTGFGCSILVHDILDFPEFYDELGIMPVGLHDLLSKSNVVSIHLPLDSTTQNILNADRLSLMRLDAVLINTARGGLVDEEFLKHMLRDNRISGAAFDVFRQEPPVDIELLQLPNFLATPHIGGSSEEAILAMGRAAIEGLDNAIILETE